MFKIEWTHGHTHTHTQETVKWTERKNERNKWYLAIFSSYDFDVLFDRFDCHIAHSIVCPVVLLIWHTRQMAICSPCVLFPLRRFILIGINIFFAAVAVISFHTRTLPVKRCFANDLLCAHKRSILRLIVHLFVLLNRKRSKCGIESINVLWILHAHTSAHMVLYQLLRLFSLVLDCFWSRNIEPFIQRLRNKCCCRFSIRC